MEHSDTLPLPASKDAAEQRNQKSSSTPKQSGEGKRGEWGGVGRGEEGVGHKITGAQPEISSTGIG